MNHFETKFKRAKRIALKYKHEKQFKKLLRQHEQAWADDKSAEIIVPFDKPIFAKYCKSLTLKGDVAHSIESEFWQNLLDKINANAYAREKKVLQRIKLRPRHLEAKEFQNLTAGQKTLFRRCFKPTVWVNNTIGKLPRISYKFLKPHLFQEKIEKMYYTHYIEIIIRKRQDGYISAHWLWKKIEQEHFAQIEQMKYTGGAEFRRILNSQFKANIKEIMGKLKSQNYQEDMIEFPRWRRSFRWLYY